MLRASLIAALVLIFAVPIPDSVQHERYRRSITVADPSARQAYFIVPPDVFLESHADLGDLRIIAYGAGGEVEVPYFVTVEQAIAGDPLKLASRLLNLGRSRQGVSFEVEVTAPERLQYSYERMRIQLAKDTPDFIATVRVRGSEEMAGPSIDLGEHRIFKLAEESIAEHTAIEINAAPFRYLHVSLEGAISPGNIRAVTLEANVPRPAAWTDIEIGPGIETIGRVTTVNFLASERYPVEAMRFIVDPFQRNFDRQVTIFADDRKIGGFRLRRTTGPDGQSVDSEDDRAVFPITTANRYRAEIDNGDDPHLHVTGARMQIVERRIYFGPKGAGNLMLYYGDDKTKAPTYDYALLNEVDQRPPTAKVGPEEHNPDFQPRPDRRPWTEKHPALLKAALALVVFVLGTIALLSIKPSDDD